MALIQPSYLLTVKLNEYVFDKHTLERYCSSGDLQILDMVICSDGQMDP